MLNSTKKVTFRKNTNTNTGFKTSNQSQRNDNLLGIVDELQSYLQDIQNTYNINPNYVQLKYHK